MGDNALYVDTDAVKANLPYMENLLSAVRQVVEILEHADSHYREFFGTEPTGRSMLAQYLAAGPSLVDGLGQYGELLDNVKTGIHTTAKGFEKVEDDTTAAAQKLHGRTGGGDTSPTHPAPHK
ncbi:hypothetical protein ACGFYV_17440 [Streptomyces sp. NPDC048297]|uniref:hypothetical protein n=1 Tax=Streptomyces sp. NPDC048297 TaxID=3365531 RepID=UPI00371AADC9